MKLQKHIPNALTCANLLCGCYACILALSGHPAGAMVAIFAAAGFDFVDGLAARLLNACSSIGKDLDSLADMVSFGVAPGMMLFDFLDRTQKTVDWSHPVCGKLFLSAAFVIPVFSALRLARFNNDARQHTSFIGLPVPAHAIFWASLLCLLVPSASPAFLPGWFGADGSVYASRMSPIAVLAVAGVLAVSSSLLLVSNIPMFSLKFKSPKWKDNRLQYTFLPAAGGLVMSFGIGGITASILLYVLLSIFNRRN
ncbi:MAG: CDP-alcohol phosphatidyltransferase family protein [Tannerella sp.]|nr:CDP-alcohol phosphatidyltransferase family protein [Tannerella sp.]